LFARDSTSKLAHANRDERVTLDSDDLEVVDKFPYLGDVLSSAGGVQEAVTARIRSGWKTFKEISGLLCNYYVFEDERRYVQKVC